MSIAINNCALSEGAWRLLPLQVLAISTVGYLWPEATKTQEMLILAVAYIARASSLFKLCIINTASA